MPSGAKSTAWDLIEELERTIKYLSTEVEELATATMQSERTRIRELCDNWRSENEEDASDGS